MNRTLKNLNGEKLSIDTINKIIDLYSNDKSMTRVDICEKFTISIYTLNSIIKMYKVKNRVPAKCKDITKENMEKIKKASNEELKNLSEEIGVSMNYMYELRATRKRKDYFKNDIDKIMYLYSKNIPVIKISNLLEITETSVKAIIDKYKF